MNKLSLLVVSCLALCACSSAPDDSSFESSNKTSTEVEWKPAPGASSYGKCELSFTRYFTIVKDGISYSVGVPTLCDLSPPIYMGDPGPDYGHVVKFENPDFSQDLIERAIILNKN